MTLNPEFIFDFGSPNAYLVHKLLPGISTRTGSVFDYKPVLIGGVFKATGNQPPMLAFSGVKGKLENYRREVARFIAKYELTAFRMNPHFPVNTLLMMRGAVFADQRGFLAEYVDAGFQHLWEDGLKMDDPDVFTKAFDDAGLDGSMILEATAQPEIKGLLAEKTQAVVDRGVFGLPVIFIGDELYFGKEHMADIEASLSA